MTHNEELNASALHRDRTCVRCGRQYPQTVLNIEGMIHHKEPPRCLDTKDCRLVKKKLSAARKPR